MCIIIYKPKGKNFPKTDDLKKFWNCNPDGAGLAIQTEDCIEVIKGIMTFEEVKIFLQELPIKEYNAVLHFRNASKGRETPLLTHPFIIGNQPKKLYYKTYLPVLFHNGTLRQFGSEEKSDTLELAEWLSKFYAKGLSVEDLVEIIRKIDISDRFILLTTEKVFLIGDFIEKEGLYYSNLFYYTTEFYNYNFFFKKKGGIDDTENYF